MVSALLPELDLHGLATGDFEQALGSLLGQTPGCRRAPSRGFWPAGREWEAWSTRRLDDLDVVYLWVDGVDVKAGVERGKDTPAGGCGRGRE